MHLDDLLDRSSDKFEALIRSKTKFCGFMVCHTDTFTGTFFREEMFRELSKYKQVESGGYLFNNLKNPEIFLDKIVFGRDHKC